MFAHTGKHTNTGILVLMERVLDKNYKKTGLRFVLTLNITDYNKDVWIASNQGDWMQSMQQEETEHSAHAGLCNQGERSLL